MKYRKKPVIVNAHCWRGDDMFVENMPNWLIDALNNGIASITDANTSDAKMTIRTLEGDHTASPGDYIIQGVAGELYPCKPDIFNRTYEPVE